MLLLRWSGNSFIGSASAFRRKELSEIGLYNRHLLKYLSEQKPKFINFVGCVVISHCFLLSVLLFSSQCFSSSFCFAITV